MSKALKAKPIHKTAAKISEVSKKVKKPAKSRRKTTRHGKGKGINKCILKIMKHGEQGGSNEGISFFMEVSIISSIISTASKFLSALNEYRLLDELFNCDPLLLKNQNSKALLFLSKKIDVTYFLTNSIRLNINYRNNWILNTRNFLDKILKLRGTIYLHFSIVLL